MTRKCSIVSDHALLRWLERVHGVDVAFSRAELEAIVGDAVKAGATSVKRDGFCYVLDGGRLITVLHKDATTSQKGRFRHREAAE